MEVLSVHVIQGLYEGVHSVAHFNISFTDANDTALFTTVTTVTHSQLGVRD